MLAINGGEPLRKLPFPSKMLGASLIGSEELEELNDVVAEKSPFRHYGLGKPAKTREFEEYASNLLGSKYVLAVSSGSAALFCALTALGVGIGDEVIVPAFSWYSDYYSIIQTGALPVFAEIDESLNLDPHDFEKKITPQTKAVIVIHYQGGSADMEKILSIASLHQVQVVEDAAQAFGGKFGGKMLGTLGVIGVASFQANKLITCGEGGLLYTDNEEYFVRAVRYHDLGMVRPVFRERIVNKSLADAENSFAGMQFRMSELQGAFMLAQIKKLPGIINRCSTYHRLIMEKTSDNRHFTFRPVPGGDIGITLFLKFASPKEAADFTNALEAEGIPTGPSSGCCNLLRHYPIKSMKTAQQSMPPFGKGYAGQNAEYDADGLCPQTDGILASYASIGIGPLYEDHDIEDIIEAIAKVINGLYEENGADIV